MHSSMFRKLGCSVCCTFVMRSRLLFRQNSTIYALSSGIGKSGVAVIRISGDHSSEVFTRMTNFTRMPSPKTANLTTIYDSISKEPLDKGITLWFPGPKSFTGEDVCELHVHGSKAVIRAILNSLSKLKNFRPAEPGEFTKRAFYAGKFDLTEVEGLSDLIDAETEMQRKQALFQLEGSLGKIYLNWRQDLIQNLAHVEAFIDFSEEENIDDAILSTVRCSIEKLKHSIEEHLNDYRKGEILRDGIKTAIIGAPNVGKSSLLNVICQKPAAIVTETAGTTRDVIESTININGYPVVIADTAGIRNDGCEDGIEKEGIRRSINEANSADLILLLMNVNDIFCQKDDLRLLSTNFSIQDAVHSFSFQYQKKLNISELLLQKKCIFVCNKIDLLSDEEKQVLKRNVEHGLVFISCRTEEGISELLNCMSEYFMQLCGVPDRNNPSLSRSRHRHYLKKTCENIDKFLALINKETADNLIFAAEELRSASQHLGVITGTIATEEILNVIFGNFCIGK